MVGLGRVLGGILGELASATAAAEVDFALFVLCGLAFGRSLGRDDALDAFKVDVGRDHGGAGDQQNRQATEQFLNHQWVSPKGTFNTQSVYMDGYEHRDIGWTVSNIPPSAGKESLRAYPKKGSDPSEASRFPEFFCLAGEGQTPFRIGFQYLAW